MLGFGRKFEEQVIVMNLIDTKMFINVDHKINTSNI